MTQPAFDQGTDSVQAIGVAKAYSADTYKHNGAVTGFGVMTFIAFVVGLTSVVFPNVYHRDINGPVATGLFIFGGAFVCIATSYWISAMNKAESFTRRLLGVRTACIIGVAVGIVGFAGTLIYRDQSGGLQMNGLETMLAMCGLMAALLVVQTMMVRFILKVQASPGG